MFQWKLGLRYISNPIRSATAIEREDDNELKTETTGMGDSIFPIVYCESTVYSMNNLLN